MKEPEILPVRAPSRTVCCCVLDYRNGNRDSCGVFTSGPDEPICDSCIKAEHPSDAAFDPQIKTVRLPR